MTTTTCSKCSGTGIVQRFLDHDGGVCYDCNGTGRIAFAARGRNAKLAPLKQARLVGDAAIADPASVSIEEAAAAHATMDANRLQWGEADYRRARALIDVQWNRQAVTK